MDFTQENRLLTIQTPLGKDVLLLTRFSGTEALSTPFSFELDLISQKRDVQFPDIIGKKVSVAVTLSDGGRRPCRGRPQRVRHHNQRCRMRDRPCRRGCRHRWESLLECRE